MAVAPANGRAFSAETAFECAPMAGTGKRKWGGSTRRATYRARGSKRAPISANGPTTPRRHEVQPERASLSLCDGPREPADQAEDADCECDPKRTDEPVGQPEHEDYECDGMSIHDAGG
jgi:hypothetical protein